MADDFELRYRTRDGRDGPLSEITGKPQPEGTVVYRLLHANAAFNGAAQLTGKKKHGAKPPRLLKKTGVKEQPRAEAALAWMEKELAAGATLDDLRRCPQKQMPVHHLTYKRALRRLFKAKDSAG